MARVQIVTDSNAYLPHPEQLAGLEIQVVPLTLRVGKRSFKEGLPKSDDAFMRKLAQDQTAVAVESPSLADMVALFGRLGKTSDRTVCIHVSAALNDIVEVAGQATGSYLGRQRIAVLDSGTTAAGLGLIVLAAAKAAAEGASQAEVVRVVRGMVPHMYALFFSDSLEYLEAWGRVGPAQALLGTMLGVKPLATMEDGDLVPVEKVRSYPHAIEKLHDFVVEFSHIEQMYIVHRGFDLEAAQLQERLEPVLPNQDFPIIGYPPSLATHVGPKALGVIVYEGLG